MAIFISLHPYYYKGIPVSELILQEGSTFLQCNLHLVQYASIAFLLVMSAGSDDFAISLIHCQYSRWRNLDGVKRCNGSSSALMLLSGLVNGSSSALGLDMFDCNLL